MAKALDMIQPAVEEVSRQLGIPSDVLLGLSQHPDLIAKIEQELKQRFSGTDEHSGTAPDADSELGDGTFDYSTALAEAFDRQGRAARNGIFPQTTATSGVVNNPELRRARVQTVLSEDKDAEAKLPAIPARIWPRLGSQGQCGAAVPPRTIWWPLPGLARDSQATQRPISKGCTL